MKILVSSLGKEKSDAFDTRFGRCEYFQIFDTETKEYEVLENRGKTSEHGAGIASSQQAIDKDVDILITGHLGPNAFEVLGSSGIKLYSANSGTVEEVINLYVEGKLEEISSAGKAHRGMGNRGGR